MATKPNPSPIDDDYLPAAFSQPPELLHKDQLAADTNNPAMEQGRSALDYGWETSASVNALRTARDPRDTPAAHAKKVAKAVDDLQREFGKKVDAARSAIQADLRRVDAELDSAAGLKANPRFEQSVCDRFHAMSPAEHGTKIAELIAADDMASLATLLEAPTIITGVSNEVRASIRERVLRAKAPMLLTLRQQLAQADEKIDRAINRALPMLAQLRSGTDKYDAKIKAAEAVAAKAGFVSQG